MSEVWSRWTGHVVNGTFPLRRYLGASDHSGVFLTEFAGREPHEVAIKLVRAIPTLVDSHGAQWEAAAELANPHLVQLLEAGQCQLDGLPYLYLVMEYADQTLAQLLEHRAMAQEEAREMLLPILDTLAFLHNRNMVQGQLKPANILVIGDTLKLASDTIRSVSDATASINMVSVYDPPEVHDGSVSTAGDMWALGITLFEALTRSPPIGMDARRDGIILPPDFSPMFRDIVRACLSRRPYDRPKAAELAARMRGQSLESGADATGAVASDQTGDGPADAARSVSKPADGFASDAVSELESGSQSATGAALEVDGREGDGARDFGSQAASGFDTHSGESALPPPGAEGSAPEANATPRPPSAASLAVSVLDKLVSILGPGSRASSAASQATAVAPDAGSKETRPLLDLPAATPPKTGEQPKPVAPVGSVAGATNRSGTIVGPGSGAYGAGAPRSVVGSAPEGNGGGHGAGRPAGLTPAGGGASSSRSTGIAGPGSAAMSGSAAASGAAAAFGSPAAVSARGAAGASGASVPEAGTIASRGAPNGATPGAHAPGAGASGTTGQGTTAPGTSALGTHAPGAPAAGSVARSSAGLGSTAPGVGAPGTSTPRGSGPMPGSAGGSAGAGRSGMNPQLDVSGRYRAVPPSAGAPAAAGGGGNGSVTATDASGRYRSVPGASPSGPGVGGAPGVAGGPGGSAGAVDASGRYRSVPGASPPASGVGTAPGVAGGPGGPGGSAGAIDASGRYRSMPGASPSGPGVGATPGSAAGATDASGRYRSVPGASASGVGTAPGGAGGPGAAAGAIDASGRYRSVPGASPSASGVGAAPGVAGGPGAHAGALDASGRYRSMPGAPPSAPGVGTAPGGAGGQAGATDASGRYRTVSTPAQPGGTPQRTSTIVSSGMTSAPGAPPSAPPRPAQAATPPGGGAQNRAASVSASVSPATAAAARAAAAAAEATAASRISSATGTASSGAGRAVPNPMSEHAGVNRPAAPAARAPAPGALDVNALNRPPFAGAIPHPVSPATIPDPAKAQRPAPRPIVIEHFTPESLVPEDTARRPGPGPKTAQPPAAPSRPPKESGFVASNAASGHLESPALTPSDVAAALESQSAFDQESSVPRSLLPLAIGTVIVLALAVAGVYVVRTHTNSTPPVVESYQDAPLPTQADAAPPVTTAEEASSDVASSSTLRPGDAASSAAAQEQSNASAGAVTRNAGALPPGTAGPFAPGARSAAAASSTAATPSGTAALSAGPASSGSGATGTAAPSGAALPAETAPLAEIHEVIPDIPPRVRESIRGHVRVAVRLIVDKEGSVFAALVDEPGPSRYFERLAIEAAKKWTFPPMETTGSRLELVRFDFTRQGATARAVEIE